MDPKDTIGLLLGAAALAITYYQARKTSQALLAGIVTKFIDEYSHQDMRESLDALETFESAQGPLLSHLMNLFAGCYDAKLLPSQTADLAKLAADYRVKHEKSLGPHRSRVAWFFSKAWRLYNQGFIDKRTLNIIFGLDGARTFVKVACPLTLAIRFSKIHKGDISHYLRDEKVLWYKDASSHIDAQTSTITTGRRGAK